MSTDRLKFATACNDLFGELCDTVHDYVDTRMANCSEGAKQAVCVGTCATLAAEAAKTQGLDLDSLIRIITVVYNGTESPLPNPDDVVVYKDPE